MSRKVKLNGTRVAALVADGFEKVELTAPRRALKSAGAMVDVVSLRRGRIRGMNVHAPARRIGVDVTVADADPNDYDALLLPGGFISPDLLRQSAEARAFVRAIDFGRKPIATLCHGPWVLASAELMTDRTVTSWPGIRDDLVHAGATWLDQNVVRDGNWVTSRGPDDLAAFVAAMLDLFGEPAPVAATATPAHASDPPRTAPPSVALKAMRWLPKPSTVVVAGLGVVVSRRLLRPAGATAGK